jgi:RNA polymerase sigma-70 factor (ECF subfamily)
VDRGFQEKWKSLFLTVILVQVRQETGTARRSRKQKVDEFMPGETTLHVQRCLDRLQAGEEAARRELIDIACGRLTRLARKMLHADRRVRRWEETDDVFQNAMMRLCRALEKITPPSARDFFRLAALQVRRELIDLARHYYGPHGPALKQDSIAIGEHADDLLQETPEVADRSSDPARMIAWTEFHEQIGALPDEQREVVDLLWYQGLTHAEAATLLQVSAKTIQRRWQAACLNLHQALGGQLPI